MRVCMASIWVVKSKSLAVTIDRVLEGLLIGDGCGAVGQCTGELGQLALFQNSCNFFGLNQYQSCAGDLNWIY